MRHAMAATRSKQIEIHDSSANLFADLPSCLPSGRTWRFASGPGVGSPKEGSGSPRCNPAGLPRGQIAGTPAGAGAVTATAGPARVGAAPGGLARDRGCARSVEVLLHLIRQDL